VELPRTREWRLSRALSQRALAERAGVAELTVIRIENGGSVWPQTAGKIAAGLGVDVRDLQKAPPVSTEETTPADLEEARAVKTTQEALAKARQTVELARHRFPELTEAELDVLAQYIRYEQDPRAVQVIIRPAPQEGEEPVDPKKVGDALQKMIAEDLLDPEQVKAVAQMALRQTAS
jgi:transcriptional regulator with XRE-family HTH domain